MQGKMRFDLYQQLYEVENTHWWHQHKRQVVHQLIDKYLPQKGKVLDVGCGTGKILEELKAKKWQVFGIDGNKEAIKWSAKRGIKIKKADFNKDKIPFEDNSFDLVLALDLLEHLPNESNLLRQIKRVLKKDGFFICTVPAYPKLFSYWDKMLGHQRRYTKKSLREVLEKNHFKVKNISYYFALHLFPTVLVRSLKKQNQKSQQKSDFLDIPLKPISVPVINLYNKIELSILKKTNLPFGLSIISISQKNE